MNLRLFAAVNIVFAFLIATGMTAHPDVVVHPLYLILLFAMCSSPLLQTRRLNDRFALLVLFSAEYFLMYGVLDFAHLLLGGPGYSGVSTTGGLLDAAECVILVGGLLVQVLYRVTCNIPQRGAQQLHSDWPERSTVIVGSILWIVSTWLSWRLHVVLIVGASIEAINSGLAQLGPIESMFYMLATYLQPLGVVFLAYAHCRYKKPYIVPLLAVALATEMVFGFVSDIKGQVFIGLVLVALTKMLVDGTLPKLRLALALAFIIILYPVLQANRVLRAEYDVNHTDAAEHIAQTFQQALTASQSESQTSDHVETFYERNSLKSSVELIVQRTGRDVVFQGGHTLTPIWATFVPRVIWPNKPNVETGRIMNEQFQVTQQEATYISPSHLGELYWNYGWIGVIGGMIIIGALLGYVGGRFDLSRHVSLTRILVLLVTIKCLILSFESAIAGEYVTWIRSLAAIGILHLLFARTTGTSTQTETSATTVSGPLFPNLLR